jgi:hypothetical protein
MSNITSTSRIVPVSATTPEIYNISLLLAGTEYSQVLSDGTKKLTIRVRDGGANLRIAFVSGDTAIKYITVKKGACYSEDNLDLDNVTVYLQSDTAGKTAEILEWT